MQYLIYQGVACSSLRCHRHLNPEFPKEKVNCERDSRVIADKPWSSFTQDLCNIDLTHQSQARSNSMLNSQIDKPQPFKSTICAEGKGVWLTDCAMSTTACIGCLADTINWLTAATITEERGNTSGSDNSRSAGSFPRDGLSSVGNSRLTDAYFSSIRATASERMVTKCRKGGIVVEVPVDIMGRVGNVAEGK